MKSYPYLQTILKVICSDLDETFMPYRDDEKPNSGIPELEKFLLENIVNHSLIFELITGSHLSPTDIPELAELYKNTIVFVNRKDYAV